MPDATITELTEADIDDAAVFLVRHSRGCEPSADSAVAACARLRWIMLANPARRDDVPLGWLLRDSRGSITGAMTCIPWRFVLDGRRFTALMSANYYVSQPYRGIGLGLFLRYIKLGSFFPLFCTTAGSQSGPLWARFGGYPIADQDHEMIGVATPRVVVEEAMWRCTGSRWLARGVGVAAATVPRSSWRRWTPIDARLEELVTVDAIDSLGLPAPAGVLTAVRDREFLHWRYFAHDAPLSAVFAYRRGGSVGPSLIAVDRAVRGHRGQIRGLTVSDVWGPLDPQDLLSLAALLDSRYSGTYDTLVFRGQTAERQAALRRAGFIRRAFAAPVAWCIDRAGLLPTRKWYLVPADAQ